MLRSFLPALALTVLSTSVASQPTSQPFSFSQWIEDIIADPSAPHLSPYEAVQAAMATANGPSIEERNPLTKRAWCRDDLASANVRWKNH